MSDKKQEEYGSDSSADFYSKPIQPLGSIAVSDSSSSPKEMQLSRDFYPTAVPIQAGPSHVNSQRQSISSRIFEFRPQTGGQNNSGLDFRWDHFPRVSTEFDDLGVDALEGMFGSQNRNQTSLPTNIDEDLQILRDIGYFIDYPNGLLGTGSYGTVFRGYYGQTVQNINELEPNRQFAVKIVDFGNKDDSDSKQKRESFETEKYILTTVSHKNIVTVKMIINMGEHRSIPFQDIPSKFYLSPERVYLFMEFAAGGELHGWMNRNKDTIVPSMRVELIRDLFFGMLYLHMNNIIHGDVHLGNVLIFYEKEPDYSKYGGQERPVAKWTDFGLGYVGDDRQFRFRKSRFISGRHELRFDIRGLHNVIHELLRGRKLSANTETKQEKRLLNECGNLADALIRNVDNLQDVYDMYKDILEDELQFKEDYFQ